MKAGNELEAISASFKITLPSSGPDPVLFSSLSLWQLLNIPSTTVLDIPKALHEEFGITPTYLDSVLKKYIIQTVGKQALEQEWDMKHSPNYYVSSTKHYSWPKSAGGSFVFSFFESLLTSEKLLLD